MTPWPHQLQGVKDVLAAIVRGQHRLCLCSPTGGGKTWMMQRLAREFLDQRQGVTLYSHRKLLITQITDALTHAKVIHGVRAAGWEADPLCLFQVASIQTEHSRSVKRKRTAVHKSGLVLVDEGHLYNNPSSIAVLEEHAKQGAAIVLVTATPIGLSNLCDELIVAGTTSELRKCGALVLAHHYGPDEPDMKCFKKAQGGEDFSEGEVEAAIMRPGIFGRVWESFGRFNPEHRPTILFAPSVKGSIWFAEQFTAKGVRAAHIDGKEIWLDGKLIPSTPEARAEVLHGSHDGTITALCNRFVLREGVDAPWLVHAIFATVFGALQSYLQSGGRLLRAHPGVDSVTVQDHGGNWWRHGSLNADRDWHLEDTAASLYGIRAERLRNKKEREPWTCPECHRINGGSSCVCGYKRFDRQASRRVVYLDGTLKELGGDIFRPHRISQRSDGPQLWERMYYRSRTAKGSRTFAAAMALFAQENHWGWPDRHWPLMPMNDQDLYRKVADVPRGRLT